MCNTHLVKFIGNATCKSAPFAVITDEKTGVKYPLADYELMPHMAIIDTDLHMSAPKGLKRRVYAP